jgi:hypothetical protein
MQILSRRSKVSSRRFYENFTSNKRCKLYVRYNFLRRPEFKEDSDHYLIEKPEVNPILRMRS